MEFNKLDLIMACALGFSLGILFVGAINLTYLENQPQEEMCVWKGNLKCLEEFQKSQKQDLVVEEQQDENVFYKWDDKVYGWCTRCTKDGWCVSPVDTENCEKQETEIKKMKWCLTIDSEGNSTEVDCCYKKVNGVSEIVDCPEGN